MYQDGDGGYQVLSREEHGEASWNSFEQRGQSRERKRLTPREAQLAALNELWPGWLLRPESDLPQIKAGERLSAADNMNRCKRFRNEGLGTEKLRSDKPAPGATWRTVSQAMKIAKEKGKAKAADAERGLKQRKLSFAVPVPVPVD